MDEQKIMIDGEEFAYGELSDNTRRLIDMYQVNQQKMIGLQRDLMIADAAMAKLNEMISQSVKKKEENDGQES